MKRNVRIIIARMITPATSYTVMADDIKIAVVGTIFDPIAQWGDMELNGVCQVTKDVNTRGGAKGNRLVGVEYDDACDPERAVVATDKVVNDGIKYVVGHLCSPSTQSASDVYEDEGILMISSRAANPELAQRGHRHIMCTARPDSL